MDKYISILMDVCVCTHTYIHICLHIYILAHNYSWILQCMFGYMHAYIHTIIYIHTYTHIHTKSCMSAYIQAYLLDTWQIYVHNLYASYGHITHMVVSNYCL